MVWKRIFSHVVTLIVCILALPQQPKLESELNALLIIVFLWLLIRDISLIIANPEKVKVINLCEKVQGKFQREVNNFISKDEFEQAKCDLSELRALLKRRAKQLDKFYYN